VYKARKQLKAEYQGLSSREIGEKIRDGETVHTKPIVTPEIAFTGKITSICTGKHSHNFCLKLQGTLLSFCS
jgi:hypothetical protein